MLLGGALSFNFLFPSNEPDIWRLMGMWSIWMFSKSYLIHRFQPSILLKIQAFVAYMNSLSS